MPISNKNKIIFLHVPKNAGTSIFNLKRFEFSDFGHANYKQYIDRYPNEWKNYLKIAIVRNPWDRFISSYEYARMLNSYYHSNDGKNSIYGPHPDHHTIKNLSFEDFVLKFFDKKIKLHHQCWAPQSDWLCDDSGKLIVDKIFKLEEISTNQEFKEIFGEIDSINKSKRTKTCYRDYYNDTQTKEIIEEVYKVDIKNFNYCF
jgi:hypothetical protein